MGYKHKPLEKLVYLEEEQKPKKIVIISCEGQNTEPQYFRTIKNKLNISVLIEIDIVPRDNKSAPKYVLSGLQEHIEDKYGYKKDYDQMWLVLDREKVVARKTEILEILPKCEEKGFSIALTNPAFEFWLLLHIVDITNYNEDVLFQNNKVSGKKRYLDQKLSEILGGYNKTSETTENAMKTIVTKENIIKALTQEQLFENDLEKIIDKLGSNIGDLIKEILPNLVVQQKLPNR